VLGEPDGAHASLADPLDQAIGTDLRPDGHLRTL
jgi:hypothetical protein